MSPHALHRYRFYSYCRIARSRTDLFTGVPTHGDCADTVSPLVMVESSTLLLLINRLTSFSTHFQIKVSLYCITVIIGKYCRLV